MRNRNLITALVAGGLALATTNLTAQGTEETLPAKGAPQLGQQNQTSKATAPAGAFNGASDLKASSIIGLAVRNESGERLGKAEDLIVSMASHSVPFAIVEYGGALGIGVTRIAVPLSDLKLASEPRELILTATREQFQSASAVPTGGWAAVAGEDWLKNVDRFYGQPSMTDESRYERQAATGLAEGREPVRNAVEQKGAIGLQDQPAATSPVATNLIGTLRTTMSWKRLTGWSSRTWEREHETSRSASRVEWSPSRVMLPAKHKGRRLIPKSRPFLGWTRLTTD